MTQPRAIAIAIIENDGKILVGKGWDAAKQETFYRPLGGGIEISERGSEALVRELQEEIKVNVTAPKFLGVLENIFTYQSQLAHEVVLVYRTDLESDALYQQKVFPKYDGNSKEAHWVALSDFRSGKAILYPEGLLTLLGER